MTNFGVNEQRRNSRAVGPGYTMGGTWDPASGADLHSASAAASATVDGLTITAAGNGALGNNIRFTIAAPAAEADAPAKASAEGGTDTRLTVTVTPPAGGITTEELAEFLAATDAVLPDGGFITGLYNLSGDAGTAAVAAGNIDLAGGRDLADWQNIKALGDGVLQMVFPGADAASEVPVTAGETLLVEFDRINAAGSTASVRLLGYKNQ